MISSFVTPPDTVETVLLINASKEQVQTCADVCARLDRCYVVYVYENGMDQAWLERNFHRVDTILINNSGELNFDFRPIGSYNFSLHEFGVGAKFLEPKDYFDK